MTTSTIVSVNPPASNFDKTLHLALNASESFTPMAGIAKALQNILCLESHAHGTSPKNYYNYISHGVVAASATKSPDDKFYVYHHNSEAAGPLPWLGQVAKMVMPRVYAARATMAENDDPDASCISGFLNKTSAVFQSFCSPTLHFHYTPDESAAAFQFEESTSGRMRASPVDDISHDRIGILGALKQGINSDLCTRIKNNPAQFFTGLAQLVSAIAIPIILVFIATLFQPLAMILIAWGVIEAALFVARIAVPILVGDSKPPIAG